MSISILKGIALVGAEATDSISASNMPNARFGVTFNTTTDTTFPGINVPVKVLGTYIIDFSNLCTVAANGDITFTNPKPIALMAHAHGSAIFDGAGSNGPNLECCFTFNSVSITRSIHRFDMVQKNQAYTYSINAFIPSVSSGDLLEFNAFNTSNTDSVKFFVHHVTFGLGYIV